MLRLGKMDVNKEYRRIIKISCGSCHESYIVYTSIVEQLEDIESYKDGRIQVIRSSDLRGNKEVSQKRLRELAKYDGIECVYVCFKKEAEEVFGLWLPACIDSEGDMCCVANTPDTADDGDSRFPAESKAKESSLMKRIKEKFSKAS